MPGGEQDSADAGPTRRQRLRAGFVNFALVVASLAVSYLAGEYIFFRHALPHLSMNLRPHLPDRADFYLQNSKAAYVPRDYIALLGDSYAQGMGDWLLSVGGKNDRPYHSANVVRDLTGQDVVTFGRAAAGSAEGLVLRVTRILGDSYCYLFPPIEPPARFFIYFYEGNDIYDNNRLVNRLAGAGAADLATRIDRFLETDYGSISQWRCHGHFGDTIFRMARFLARDAFAKHRVLDLPPTKNQAIVDGRAVGTPELQTPPVNLDEGEIADGVTVYARSLAFLRRRFPDAPITVVYIPAPASTYRYAHDEVIAKDVYLPDESRKSGRYTMIDGASFPIERIYAASRHVCEAIRAASLQAGVGFLDARPAFRQAATRRAVHGPRDWNHLNEDGYRLLGALVAAHMDDRPTAACDDSWPE